MDSYDSFSSSTATVAQASAADRASFIRRTYLHVAGAILAFTLLETYLLQQPWALDVVRLLQGRAWLIVLFGFMGVSWLADRWARSEASPAKQYLGLGLYTAALALVFLPILLYATRVADAHVLPTAGIMTALLFGGLTATAFLTRKDFSFLRGILVIGGFVALGLVVCGALFNFPLGMWFSGAMVLFAGGSILYTTSNIMHHYRVDQHVAAALALFAGVMTLFFYILRFLLGRRS